MSSSIPECARPPANPHDVEHEAFQLVRSFLKITNLGLHPKYLCMGVIIWKGPVRS